MSDAIQAGTITMASGDGDSIEAYLAHPVDGPARGGIVVIHHAPGYDRWTKEVVRRFAADGYAALCPNLYSRQAPGAAPDDAAAAVRAAGGVPVPFSDLMAPEFLKAPEQFFSSDMFHPSAAGYSLAASQLLPALLKALGEWNSGGDTEESLASRSGEFSSWLARVGGVTRLWRRTTGVPAPIVPAVTG